MDYELTRLPRGAPRTSLFTADDYADVNAFFTSRPDLWPTPLKRLSRFATDLGLDDVIVKDESRRFGLPAFKIVGVAYAVDRLLRTGGLASDTLVAATAGNHGRAVARVARDRGLRARIYVPETTVAARRAAIATEGADVVVVSGNYEAAVRQAAADADRHGWTVVSDTAWSGYDTIPRWIMTGYTWILEEAARQWAPGAAPDVVVVQAGVGGLAGAVASWCADRLEPHPFVIVAEPTAAACALASVRNRHALTLEGPLTTVMAGLRCAEVSPVAWPCLAGAVDAFIAVEDTRAESIMRRLARPAGEDPSIEAGASGACGLAALVAITMDEELRPVREAANLGLGTTALAIVTEGATDPDHYGKVVAGLS